MPSVVFCGTPQFAVPSLKALAADKRFDVKLVVTQPDKPVGKEQIVTEPPVKVVAEEFGIPVFQPESLNEAFAAKDKRLGSRPDFLIVVAYGQILSRDVLAWPAIAPINIHGSLLPRWRGASPIQWSILSGDKETGVTIQKMEYELDAGPIYAKKSVEIRDNDTTPSLMNILADLGANLLMQTLTQSPFPEPVPQPAEGVTFCKKLSKTDGLVDPSQFTAVEIDRKVRALQPWPGVTATIDGIPIKILRCSPRPTEESTAIACKDGTTLHLIQVRPASGKTMSGAAWMRGRK